MPERAVLVLAALLLLAPFVVADEVADVVGAPRGPQLAGGALEAETARVSSLLRCPVCQGLSVYDSPAPMAVNMKKQVRDLLSRGYDEEQILEYFVNSYGEFVLLRPRATGINWLVWLAPIGVLLAGVLAVRAAMRKVTAPLPAGPDTPVEDPALDEYRRRVRQQVYGVDEESRGANV